MNGQLRKNGSKLWLIPEVEYYVAIKKYTRI
jgi:hypothetical protein